MTMSAKAGTQTISMPMGDRKPREIAMALTAWLTAPAPTAWTSTTEPSFIMPAMAPATEAGDDFEETFRHPISGLALSVGTVLLHLSSVGCFGSGSSVSAGRSAEQGACPRTAQVAQGNIVP